jgi:hypothetical protein
MFIQEPDQGLYNVCRDFASSRKQRAGNKEIIVLRYVCLEQLITHQHTHPNTTRVSNPNVTLLPGATCAGAFKVDSSLLSLSIVIPQEAALYAHDVGDLLSPSIIHWA